jgi:gamma-glutamyltranspeptidase/glutathione hydrolase
LEFRWEFPYDSRRMPVVARQGMVATSQPLACSAGMRTLLQGGNAVDAAIATAAALTVVEPTSNGLGSDAFAMVWEGENLRGLNSSGRSPAGLSRDELVERCGSKMPITGWLPVTVPGAVAAWVELWRQFGRLPFSALLEPAIEYAEKGFPVSPITAYAWERGARRLGSREDYASVFLPGGRPPRAGEMVTLPEHARTLRLIGETEGESFYRGELAERIASYARESGGYLTEEDMSSHRAEWVRPMHVCYRGVDVWELPPNTQGAVALQALSILDGFDLSTSPHLGVDYCHLVAEALKLAFADAYQHIADPLIYPFPAELRSPEYTAKRRALVGDTANPEPITGLPRDGGTVYLCTADADGYMVSFIQSNYMGFGSGVVVPGTGIALQNRGVCFVLEKGHPNDYSPGKRPFHTIIPAFLGEGGIPHTAFGVMGGDMQPQGHVQVVSGMVDYGLNPQAALDAPRIKVLGGPAVSVESSLAADVIEGLVKRGHDAKVDRESLVFGGGQIIYRDPHTRVLIAGSDSRKDGLAIGY